MNKIVVSEISEVNLKNEEQPSVTSDNPEERKLARRQRIQRRLEAAEKQKAIADGSYVKPEPEKPLIEETIETCEDTLRQLYFEGKELVSNVMIASDSKEVERRETEAEEKNLRLEKLRKESALALEKLNEISVKWEAAMEKSGPLELYQHMKEQKAKCLELIEQKNELIKSFQMELKMADEKFMKDRKAMYEELGLLTRRIDDQVLLMKRAYRIEIDHIEEAVDETREQIVDKHMKIWQSLYNQREKNETVNMDRKFKMVDNFHEELHQLHIDHEEKYRETRIQLETDIQILEQELEQIKALCLLNSEKLDYNYQVLKKREEENVYIKNHQKRRLNKLQDLVNTLKKRIDDKRQSTEEEYKRLTKDVERYYANVVDTEKKAEHFSKVNDEKFLSIWEMKDEEAKDLIDKILSADMVIHEQILGVPWTPPPITTINKMDLPSYKMAVSFVSESRESRPHHFDKPHIVRDLKETETTTEVLQGHRRLLRHILELIADQSGFLIEEKLDELLKPYSEDEKTFVQLDNVFMAIGIQTEKDIETMKKIFLPYTVCLFCERTQSSMLSFEFHMEPHDLGRGRTASKQLSILQIRELEEKVSKLRIQAKANGAEANVEDSDESPKKNGKISPDWNKDTHDYGRDSPESKRGSHDARADFGASTKKDQKFSSVRGSHDLSPSESAQKDKTATCNITHPLVIEKHNVLKALKDFVSVFHAKRCRTLTGLSARLGKKRYSISRLLSKDDVNIYWEKYKELLPTKIDKIWNGIFLSLNRYLAILQERHELNVKAQALRKQNLDLKKLLTYYKAEERKHLVLPAISTVPDEPIDITEIENIANKLAF